MERATMWGCVTSRHDWRDGSFLERFLAIAAGVGALGDAAWLQVGYSGRKKKVAVDAGSLGARIRELAGDARDVEAGGKAPDDWVLTVHVGDWREDAGKVDGINLVQIRFPAGASTGKERSELLRDAFRDAHGAGTTEVALIHPWEPWLHLRGAAYQRAVTTGLSFPGAAWATFIGPGHLELFDRSRLEFGDAFTAEWKGDDASTCSVAPISRRPSPPVRSRSSLSP